MIFTELNGEFLFKIIGCKFEIFDSMSITIFMTTTHKEISQ